MARLAALLSCVAAFAVLFFASGCTTDPSGQLGRFVDSVGNGSGTGSNGLNPGGSTSNPSGSSPTPGSPDPANPANNPDAGNVPSDASAPASLATLQVFPPDNPWNQDISALPVHPNSAAYLASIGPDKGLHPDFGTVYDGAPNGIPFVVVAPDQATTAVHFDYDDESDPGPYPIPANPPIEGGPNSTGDRHILMVDVVNKRLYELFSAYPKSGGWTAGSGAIFDLSSNALRPAGWTSADAAGLPIFPGLVRYDEVVERGEIKHALRFTVHRTQKAYISPARHFASSDTDAALPPMGLRLRLKASVNISTYPASVQAILRALKTYGMFVADNGADWYISGAPDPRWRDDDLATIRTIRGRDFEVVYTGDPVTR